VTSLSLLRALKCSPLDIQESSRLHVVHVAKPLSNQDAGQFGRAIVLRKRFSFDMRSSVHTSQNALNYSSNISNPLLANPSSITGVASGRL